MVQGARLLPDPGFIAKLSAHAAGDVVGALVHWSRERALDRHRNEIARAPLLERTLRELSHG